MRAPRRPVAEMAWGMLIQSRKKSSIRIIAMPVIDEAQVREASKINERYLRSRSVVRSRPGALPLEALLHEIQQAASLPLKRAVTLPAEAYTSSEYFDWECEHVFRAGWLAVAHVSQLPLAGDFVNIDVLGEPLLVVRDKSLEIRVLSRTCPHRGMDIMPPGFGYDGHGPVEFRQGGEDRGHTRLFLCPYHAWTFELDGGLKACAEMGQAEDFCREDWKLKHFRTEVWKGFVFVNLDGEAESTVAEQWADLGAAMVPWEAADLQVVFESHWDIPCNWKVLAENFMESYHHAGAHAKTLQPLMPARDTWTEPEHPHFIRCHLPFRQRVRADIARVEGEGEQWDAFPPIPGLTDVERHEWGLFMAFPLFTFVTAPDQLVWYRIEPRAPDALHLTTAILVPESTTRHPQFPEMVQRGQREATAFHLEDMEMLAAVQRGLHAQGYQRGRLSHLEMPIWLIQRHLARTAKNAN